MPTLLMANRLFYANRFFNQNNLFLRYIYKLPTIELMKKDHFLIKKTLPRLEFLEKKFTIMNISVYNSINLNLKI